MNINSINNKLYFCANQNADSSNGSSSMTTTAINAATGAIVGAGVGGVGCLMPVSKKNVAETLCDTLILYKKEELPVASEIQNLTKKLKGMMVNNETLNFINQIKEMSDDEFSNKAKSLANNLNLPKTSTKEDIIKAAEKKLIGKSPKIVEETVIQETQQKLANAQGNLLEYSKKYLIDNPKDELVKLSKKVAKSTRNSKLLKSSIKFGFMATMLFGVYQAISNSKSSNKNSK